MRSEISPGHFAFEVELEIGSISRRRRKAVLVELFRGELADGFCEIFFE